MLINNNAICCVYDSAYKVVLTYKSGKSHVQQNLRTKFKRNVRRVAQQNISPVGTANPAGGAWNAQTASSTTSADQLLSQAANQAPLSAKMDLGSGNTIPTGSSAPMEPPVAPLWEYVDPKDKQWKAFTGAFQKMIEGLSKRSAVFAINLPGLGGYQVSLATMTMKSSTPENSTQIRRTPALVSTTAAPVLFDQNSAASSSSSSSTASPSSSTSKKSSGKRSAPGGLFDVDTDLLARCKKATGWKSVSSKDATNLLADSNCVICCDDFTDNRAVVRLSKCGSHYFHENCIAASFKPGFICCPVCKIIYGIRTGTMPEGRMVVKRSSEKLPGYEKHGCITISYSFSNGTQQAHHPSPGKPYHGTSRTAYLPDCPEGEKVLKLLEIAFERRLTFTIGTSVTTGQSDCVIWNGIHHKTSKTGGSTNFGYPDSTYLQRVTEELAAQGVTLDD